ncbi:hypothetical protein TNCV_691921 [Trichonephila clavipes]|nr:hypothetical protein TNCV_691921 [Trichonephila clavipes]
MDEEKSNEPGLNGLRDCFRAIGKKSCQEGGNTPGGHVPGFRDLNINLVDPPNINPLPSKSGTIGLTLGNDILVCNPSPAPSRLSLVKKL